MVSARPLWTSFAALAAVTCLASCGQSATAHAVAAADAYARAVYVDRDCVAAPQMLDPALKPPLKRSWCAYYRGLTGWGSETFLVKGSRRVLPDCGRLGGQGGFSPDVGSYAGLGTCVRYITASRSKNPSPGPDFDYKVSDLRVFVGKRGGVWKILGWGTTWEEGCIGSPAPTRDCGFRWLRRRVPLHSTGPL
jgi:hypothetical protein